MKIDKSTILARLEELEPSEAVRRARILLSADDTRGISSKSHRVKAREALSLWTVRLLHVESAGKVFYGASQLLDRLRSLPPGLDLEQMGFTSEEMLGIFFFRADTGEFVGLQIMDRHRPGKSDG